MADTGLWMLGSGIPRSKIQDTRGQEEGFGCQVSGLRPLGYGPTGRDTGCWILDQLKVES